MEAIRAKSFGEFVGQKDVVAEIMIAIRSSIARMDAFPHMVMSGPPGLGKTTMAQIIAIEMKVPFFSVMASAMDSDTAIEELLAKLPSDGYDMNTGDAKELSKIRYPVLFIDEIHNMKRKITETMHTVLEDFVVTLRKKNLLTGRVEAKEFWVPRFTLIGATNYLGSLPRPFLDRFKLQVQFEAYPDEDIRKVIEGASDKLKVVISKKAMELIASKSRGVPRISIRLLEKARDISVMKGDRRNIAISTEHVKEMFDVCGIDKMGLTRLDRKVLAYMAKTVRPVGLESIAQVVEEDVDTVSSTVEPWLVKQGLIVRTPQGRQITAEGLKHLGVTGSMFNSALNPLIREQ